MVIYEPYTYGVGTAKVPPSRFWNHAKSQILRSSSDRQKRKKPRGVRILIFFICVAGCAYQICSFLIIYFSYPTTINIEVGHNSEMQPPGVTVCNANRFRRTAFCRMFPANCYHPSNASDWCAKYPVFCKEGEDDLFMPLPDSGKDYEYSCNRTLNVKLGHYSDPLVKRVEWLTTDTTVIVQRLNYTLVPMSEGVTCPVNCYLVNSLILDPYGPLPNASLNTDERKIMKLFLDLEPEEYFNPERSIEAVVHVHTQFSIQNPFIHGFIVKPGNIYYVDLTMTEEKTLPPPYTTMCHDYFKSWEKERKGPLTWEMCVHSCKLEKTKATCNCVSSRITYPHDQRYCGKEDEVCVEYANEFKCYKECKQECYSRKFKYSVASKRIPEDLKHFYESIWGDIAYQMRDRSVIMIFMLRDPQALVYTHRPKYETIELYSYLGGYSGIWLGISLFTIFDFIQQKIAAFYRNFRNKKKIITQEHKSDICKFRKAPFLCPHHLPSVAKDEQIGYLS